jgi:tetratricopeptide (TPR) repeat protein
VDDQIHQQTEKIVAQAQEFGGFLYKNATSFLKTGREKVTRAVGDWQEQQRTQRLQQPTDNSRPKWMKENVDLENNAQPVQGGFVDDADSDEEGSRDLELERSKIQEMRRIQEAKQREQAAAAHKIRIQQKAKQENLIGDDVYVSPSRRRGGNSGRSTPQSRSQTPVKNPSPSPTPPSPQQPKKAQRARPIINAPADVMRKVNEARNEGNDKFKLGQFGDAEVAYTRALELLPEGHDHQVLLCNNRAVCRLKNGDYKKCIQDCDTAFGMAQQSGENSVSEGVTIQWRDQIIKSLSRKGEAFENIEKYKEALDTYNQLVKYNGTHKVNQAMARCRQALNPKKKPAVTKKQEPAPVPEKKDDLMSMFDPTMASPASVGSPQVSAEELNKSKAVAAMRAKAAQQEADDAEKLQKTDDVNARLVAWKAGKEQNLRALLATLDSLIWPGAQWKGAQMSELINPKKCKIAYMRAIAKVHPDKVRGEEADYDQFY